MTATTDADLLGDALPRNYPIEKATLQRALVEPLLSFLAAWMMDWRGLGLLFAANGMSALLTRCAGFARIELHEDRMILHRVLGPRREIGRSVVTAYRRYAHDGSLMLWLGRRKRVFLPAGFLWDEHWRGWLAGIAEVRPGEGGIRSLGTNARWALGLGHMCLTGIVLVIAVAVFAEKLGSAWQPAATFVLVLALCGLGALFVRHGWESAAFIPKRAAYVAYVILSVVAVILGLTTLQVEQSYIHTLPGHRGHIDAAGIVIGAVLAVVVLALDRRVPRWQGNGLMLSFLIVWFYAAIFAGVGLSVAEEAFAGYQGVRTYPGGTVHPDTLGLPDVEAQDWSWAYRLHQGPFGDIWYDTRTDFLAANKPDYIDDSDAGAMIEKRAGARP